MMGPQVDRSFFCGRSSTWNWLVKKYHVSGCRPESLIIRKHRKYTIYIYIYIYIYGGVHCVTVAVGEKGHRDLSSNPGRSVYISHNDTTLGKCMSLTIISSTMGKRPAHFQVGRVFANGTGDLGSIPGRVIPETLKIVLDTSLLNTQRYKVLSKVKWSNPWKGEPHSHTPRCSSYGKGSLLVTLDYGCQQ